MSKKQKAAPEENSPLMYCGPSIPGVATPGLIFTQEPPLLVQHLDACPALRALVVEPREFTRTTQAIKRLGSIEQTLYRKALEYLKEV